MNRRPLFELSSPGAALGDVTEAVIVVRRDGPNGYKVVSANDFHVQRLLETKTDPYDLSSLLERLSEEDRPRVLDALDAVASGSGSVSFVTAGPTRGGRYLRLSISQLPRGEILYIAIIVYEETPPSQKVGVEALNDAINRVRSGVAIVEFATRDPAETRVVYANPHLLELLGVDPTQPHARCKALANVVQRASLERLMGDIASDTGFVETVNASIETGQMRRFKISGQLLFKSDEVRRWLIVVEPLKEEAHALSIDLFSGRVRHRGSVVPLSDGALELLAALAYLRDRATKEALAELMWPEMDGSSGQNLRTAVSRARKALREPNIILNTPTGYALAHVSVDAWEAEELLRAAPHAGELTEALRERLTVLERSVSGSSRVYAQHWEWFPQFDSWLSGLHQELVLLLAKDAFRRDDMVAVSAFCDRLLDLDQCDETAYELKIRSLLQSGDRSGAMRIYRRYRELLKREFDAEPSEALKELVTAS